jgi:hypothetical protein
MKYTLASVAKVFKVDRKIVKDWAYFFSDYLTSGANPDKGTERIFKIEDIRVMAYIFSHWEDDPDIESIKIGLNKNSHYEHELINDLIVELSPFFVDPPENIDETWKHGVLFCGLAQFGDQFYLANSYKLAGDGLIDLALEKEEAWSLFCPAVFNYRHATELYLKAITGCQEQTHNLNVLLEKFEKLILDEYKEVCPDWFKNVIFTFDTFDPGGTTFRYGGNLNSDEIFIDFVQMKTLMSWMEKSFHNIRRRQGLPDVDVI